MKTENIHWGILPSASFISMVAALLLSVTACDNKDYSKDSPFDNAVYIDAAKVKDVANFTFNNTKETGQLVLSAELAYPIERDVDVTFKVDPSLIRALTTPYWIPNITSSQNRMSSFPKGK